jgi:HSP20 family molecular chaperone IbpA
MWTQALEMLEEADRLHRQFFQFGPQGSAAAWQPPVDIIEDGEELWMLVALPGVEPSRMHVRFDGAVLVITAERPLPAHCRAGAIRRLEIPYGHFERRIPIPTRHFELHEQHVDNGCLVIGLRRVA